MTEQKKKEFNLDTEEMTRAGLHFGHKTSRINPKMKPYLFGVRNGVHIMDLEKTKEKFSQALDFVSNLISEEKTLLLVGTKVQVKESTEETAKECGLPYVSERWLGGTFTNFPNIQKRIQHYKELERKKAEGELEKYTKKEQLEVDRELETLKIKFGGIKDMEKLPHAVFICDMKHNNLAVKEARQKGIKVIGICDTNVDPDLADYPIPANDDAFSSVKYILDKVKKAIKNGQSRPVKKAS